MAETIKKIPRPLRMKGLVASYYKLMVPLGICVSIGSGYLFWHFTGARHKRLNYDPDRDYIRMREAGVFQSAPALGHYKLNTLGELKPDA